MAKNYILIIFVLETVISKMILGQQIAIINSFYYISNRCYIRKSDV